MNASHRIDELVFDITFASPTLEMTQADALRALVVDRLLPVMEQVFDDYADSDTVWQIDTLEVDVGNVNEAGLPPALASSLRMALTKALQGAATGTSMMHRIPGKASGKIPRSIPRSQADVEMLLAFLADGTLPWQLAGEFSGSSATIHESLLQKILKQDAGAFLPAWRASPRRNVQIARLVRQFPVSAIAGFIAPYSAG